MQVDATPAAQAKSILVLGAYGLIGSGFVQALTHEGHLVSGVGRDLNVGRRVFPNITWHKADLTELTDTSDWTDLLRGVDVVVNCSGALQDGPADDLEAIHHHMVASLADACSEADVHLIQISAVGATEQAETTFLSSKARGDAAIVASGSRHHILKPGLVLARHSYGGTMMLRMLASFPVVQPIAVPTACVQTISLDDLAQVVCAAVRGDLPDGFVGDLIEPEPHTLREVIAKTRGWLGIAPARYTIIAPPFIANPISRVADGLGHLGWRSPLRTTAIKVLTEGVTGSPTDVTQYGIPSIRSLDQTFSAMPARAGDRLSARMSLLMPVIITTLVLFWAMSGVVGLIRVNAAASVLENVGWPVWLAVSSVVFWAFVDIAIAIGFAIRRFAKLACWAAISVSLFYIVASTIFTPFLWLDPLGPLVKIFPSIVLALVARVVLEAR